MPADSTAYNLVADALREQILRGAFSAGQQLPTERDLCLRFGASRITIRRALQILQEEMLVQRRQGSGTFVSPTPSRRIPILCTDFVGSIARHAPKLKRQLHERRWISCAQSVADQLNILPGARVLFARRIDLLSQTPVALDEIHLLARYAEGLDDSELSRVDFVDRWRFDHDLDFDYCTQTIEAVPAERRIARLLKVKSRDPLLKETNVIVLAGGQPVGLFESYYRHQYFRMNSTCAFTQEPAEVA